MKLNKLILSLSTAEKRFFNFLNNRKSNTTTPKALKLFHFVDLSNRLSKDEISKSDRFPVEDLARTKYRLNQLIEQSLVFHSSGMFKFQPDILDLLRLSKVYYQKNLYDQCLKTITKGLDKSKEEEDFSSILSFLEVLEKVTFRRPSAIHQSFETQVGTIAIERKNCLLKLERISLLKELYFNISLTLLHRTEINHEQFQQKKNEIEDKVKSIDSDFLSTKEQFIFFKIKQAYFLLIDDVKSCLHETRVSLDFIEQNLKKNYFLVEDYLITYQNLIVAHINLGDLGPVDQLLGKLSRFKVSSKNKPLQKLQESVIHISEIRYAYKKREFSQVLSRISKLNTQNTVGFIHAKNLMEIGFIEIFSNFALRKYTISDNLIRNYLANIPKSYSEIDRAGVLILNILVNWELGIRELIPSICDASRYYFKRIDSYEESDRIILSWFKSNLSRKVTPSEFKTRVERLKTNLSNSKLTCSHKFQQVYFSYWMESILTDTNLVDLLNR